MKRWFLGSVALLAACVPFATPASAQEAPAQLRVAHLSPDTPGVDVYVDGAQAVGNMGFETVTDYLPVPPGSHELALRPSGAAPSSAPVWTGAATLESGKFYTAAGLGPRAQLEAHLFTDDMTTPAPGNANVRFLHAAVGTEAVDVTFGGSPLSFTDAAFATPTDYQAVAAGKYDVTLTDGSGADLVGSQSIEFSPGVTYTVAAIGGGGTPLRLLPVVDARGVVVSPVGALSTGAGGTAPRPHPGPGLLLPFIVGGVLITAAVAIAGARRRLRVDSRVRSVRLVATLVGLLLVGSTVWGWGRDAPGGASRPPPAPTTTSTTPEVADPWSVTPTQPAYAPTPVRLQEPVPARLDIAAIGVATELVPLGLRADGTMEVPRDFDRAGWYIAGPKPGETGPAVIAGHVDNTSGPAVFYRLKDLTAGADIVVTRVDGTSVTFRVARVASYEKQAFPTAEVFGPTPESELRLVTCGGDFDWKKHSYKANVVVYADRVPS